jgi:phenylalanyl-tRNA synthetase beta chain
VPVAPPISTFPPVHTDVAVGVPAHVPAADVEAALRRGAGDLLERMELFDVYTGAQVGEGQKSLAYALTLRAPDRTLTRGEVNDALIRALDEVQPLGGVLRGEIGSHGSR